ncbi:MAG: hypothetical protein PHG97_04130 [Candidatus Margulisbacteria bacterium]|nr:hypothetical protein [Candidatus Margulisiibacteriota bacterium]
MKTALYSGGVRTPDHYFTLKMLKGVDASPRLHVTRAAVRQTGGEFGSSIYGLSADGIRVKDRICAIPFIYIRLKTKLDRNVHKIFISDSELTGLSGEFGLTERAAARSFFIFSRDDNLKCDTLHVAPIWSELLDPDWRDAFLSWLADPAGNQLPDPDSLAWQTFSDNTLTMPALRPAVNLYDGARRIIKGELVLKRAADSAQAYFHYNGRISIYQLSESRVEYLGKDLAGNAADFDKGIFIKLFGGRPEITDYAFSKRARKDGVSFMQMRGERFVLRSSSLVPLKEGELYYFKFIRRENNVLVLCYADQARTRLVGGKKLGLIEGFPGAIDQSIEPPDRLPPNLI